MKTPTPTAPNALVPAGQPRRYYVSFYPIIGTSMVIAAAYEDGVFNIRDGFTHGTFSRLPTSLGDKQVGHLGTRSLPAEIEAMRGNSDERVHACRAHRIGQQAEAWAAIDAALATLPEAYRLARWRQDGADREVLDDAALASAVHAMSDQGWVPVEV